MRVLVVPEPVMMGTCFAESLLSSVKRTSNLYDVSVARVVRLAMTVGGMAPIAQDYNGLSCWLGGSSHSRALVAGLKDLSGRDLGPIALVPQSAVWTSAASLLAQGPRICPECTHPDTGTEYEMLCHQMAHVVRCPLHGCMLNDSCLACGQKFGVTQWLASGATCRRCTAPLWDQMRMCTKGSAYERWCEEQALELIAATASDEFDVHYADWTARFHAGAKALSASPMEDYQIQEREYVREDLVTREKVRFKTLLKIASMQACSLVDLIRRPEEMLSPRLPKVGQVVTPRVGRVKIPEVVLEQVKARIEALIASDTTVQIPSKASVFKDFKFACPRIWRMHPELSVAYSAELRKRSKQRKDQQNVTASTEAAILLRALLLSGGGASNRALTDCIQACSGVTRQAAEFGLRVAKGEISKNGPAWRFRKHETELDALQLRELMASSACKAVEATSA